jgi:gamma-glutamyltranspeptidase/glutathione hydrolase
VVAAGHPAVADAARRTLVRGGNAVDAVVAAMFVSFHAEPILAGPGGAGFLVARIDGEPAAWDFFSTAPGLGTGTDPYKPKPGGFFGVDCDFGSTVQTFYVGAGSVAVPSGMQGMLAVQSEAGRLTLAEVLEPGVAACAEGTEVTRMSWVVSTLLRGIVDSTHEYSAFFTQPNGDLLAPGQRFRNPDLGNLYETVIREGSSAMVDGAPARALVAEVQRHGGGLTMADMAAYRVARSKPLVGRMGDAEMLLVPPPSSGGMLIGYGAALLDGFDVPEPGSRGDVLLMRAVLAESLRARGEVVGSSTPSMAHAHTFADGAFVEAGRKRVQTLLDRGPEALPPLVTPSLGSTTHVSVIDGDGNAAACTVSIGEASGLVVPGYGIFPNNFLGEEDLNPLGFHAFPPGVRMGSSMSPTLLVQPDGAMVALGTGGANRIRTALLQVMRHVVRHDATVDEAVRWDRLHYENDTLYAECANGYADAIGSLEADGTPLTPFPEPNMFFGGVHVAARSSDGEVLGVGDDRRSGEVAVA